VARPWRIHGASASCSCSQGSQAVAERLMDHAAVAAITFVGSSPVAAAVYRGAAAQGKVRGRTSCAPVMLSTHCAHVDACWTLLSLPPQRCQALGGAKNFLIIMCVCEMRRGGRGSAKAGVLLITASITSPPPSSMLVLLLQA
jgi:hypothetical protein